MDFDLMKFYQTYVKYAILVKERRESFSTVRVGYLACSAVATFVCVNSLNTVASWSMGRVLKCQKDWRVLD